MATNSFFNMYLEKLNDIFDAENQIVAALPKVIQAASDKDLKQALSDHLNETKEQVNRLKEVFQILDTKPSNEKCDGMQGILKEGSNIINKKEFPHAVKDAALIIACQHVEHYEIAAYGSLLALNSHLNEARNGEYDYDTIRDLLQQNLNEEKAADETLTGIAEGGFFAKGINAEAEAAKAGAGGKSKNK